MEWKILLLQDGDQSDPEPEAYVEGYSYDDVSDSTYYYGSESLDLTASQSADPEPTSYDLYGVSGSANSYPLYQTQGKNFIFFLSNV